MLNKRILVLIFVVAFLTLLIGCLPGITPSPPKGVIGGRIMAPPGPETTKDITGWIPLANATVTITDSEGVTHTVTTDEDGYYTFTDIAVDANTIITAAGTVDGNTVIVKDVIPKAVAADEDYEAGIADAESTALALIVEELLKQGVDPGDINLEGIQASDNFNEVVEQVDSILEANGNVTTDPSLTNTVGNVAEDIINPPGPTPGPTPVFLTSIVVNPKTMTLFVEETEDIVSVTAHYSDGSTFVIDQQGNDCGYGSSDDSIAEVSVTGEVTAVGEGIATITVMYKSKTDTIAVTVTNLPMEIIADMPTFKVGEETGFTAEVVANDDVDKTVKFYFTLPIGITEVVPDIPPSTGLYTVELFYEVVGDWLDLGEGATGIESLDVELGGANGDPLIDEVKYFKATFSEAGTYEITVEVRTYPDDLPLYSKDISAVVIDLVQNTDTGEYYHTIQAAINAADPGDTIEVAAGTYNENITIDKSLTIVSVDGALATIINAQGDLIAVLINGAETTATFDGFTVKNYETIGILAGAFSTELNGIQLGDDPIEAHILNNIVEEPGAEDKHNNCIQVGDGTTGTVIGNEVFGAWLVSPKYSGSGILVAGSSNVLVSENYVHDCEGGIQICGYAIHRDAPAENNLIENNLVENCKAGISIQMNSIGTTIRYNNVLNNDTGIGSVGNISWEMTIPSGTEIHYNNIIGNANYGVKSSVWSSGDAEQVDATNNWWGDATGPYHGTTNPAGLGDAVSDNVDFSSWE